MGVGDPLIGSGTSRNRRALPASPLLAAEQSALTQSAQWGCRSNSELYEIPLVALFRHAPRREALRAAHRLGASKPGSRSIAEGHTSWPRCSSQPLLYPRSCSGLPLKGTLLRTGPAL